MSEDATREAEDTPVVEAGIKVEFSEERKKELLSQMWH